jgi:glycosyltransferase involved in cell wall biosynthesis
MVTLDICFPVLNQEEMTQKAVDSFKRTQTTDNVNYIVVDNGSKRFVRDWLLGLTEGDQVIRNSENVGLPKAMNQARALSKADYILFTHTDVEMFEVGWDEKIKNLLNGLGSVGVAGFFGAKGLGAQGIYHLPYQMQQLIRWGTMAGNRCRLDPNVHGHRQFDGEFERCAVLDGFALIVHNGLRFWDKSPHHNYDNDICLESIDQGLQNIVINMDCIHHGGRTDVNEDWAFPFGKSKAEIHAESHVPLYEKWRPGNRNITLPYSVS